MVTISLVLSNPLYFFSVPYLAIATFPLLVWWNYQPLFIFAAVSVPSSLVTTPTLKNLPQGCVWAKERRRKSQCWLQEIEIIFHISYNWKSGYSTHTKASCSLLSTRHKLSISSLKKPHGFDLSPVTCGYRRAVTACSWWSCRKNETTQIYFLDRRLLGGVALVTHGFLFLFCFFAILKDIVWSVEKIEFYVLEETVLESFLHSLHKHVAPCLAGINCWSKSTKCWAVQSASGLFRSSLLPSTEN